MNEQELEAFCDRILKEQVVWNNHLAVLEEILLPPEGRIYKYIENVKELIKEAEEKVNAIQN